MHIASMKKLADWLRRNNIGDADFASRVGTDRTTISRIRRGKQRPSLDLAGRIAAATKGAITANDFVEPVAPDQRRKASA